MRRKYIDFVRAMQTKTGGETFVPAKIKGVHRALEKMALRESANRPVFRCESNLAQTNHSALVGG